MMQAKPMRSVAENRVLRKRKEKRVALTGSVVASIAERTGPMSPIPCMNREKDKMVPTTITAATAS